MLMRVYVMCMIVTVVRVLMCVASISIVQNAKKR